jgi:hypothetical protein
VPATADEDDEEAMMRKALEMSLHSNETAPSSSSASQPAQSAPMEEAHVCIFY